MSNYLFIENKTNSKQVESHIIGSIYIKNAIPVNDITIEIKPQSTSNSIQ